MNPSTQKIIDIVQWVLIVFLLLMLGVQGIWYRRNAKQLEMSMEYNKENTYVRVYESQKVEHLKNENRELYDSIAKLKDVEYAMLIEFQEHYKSDKITGDKFTLKRDTVIVYKDDEMAFDVDSIYHYAEENDSVKLELEIKARDLQWVTTDITLNDRFIIVNREKNGVNETSIHTSPNTTIEETAMWHKKNNKKWYQKFSVGPQVGVGYGLMNGKVDVYAGLGVTYSF